MLNGHSLKCWHLLPRQIRYLILICVATVLKLLGLLFFIKNPQNKGILDEFQNQFLFVLHLLEQWISGFFWKTIVGSTRISPLWRKECNPGWYSFPFIVGFPKSPEPNKQRSKPHSASPTDLKNWASKEVKPICQVHPHMKNFCLSLQVTLYNRSVFPSGLCWRPEGHRMLLLIISQGFLANQNKAKTASFDRQCLGASSIRHTFHNPLYTTGVTLICVV